MTTTRSDLPPQLLTLPQTAAFLQTCTKTVRRLIQAGQLPHIRTGRQIRIHPDDLNRYVATCRHTSQ